MSALIEDPFGCSCVDCGRAMDPDASWLLTEDGDPVHAECADDEYVDLDAVLADMDMCRVLVEDGGPDR
jgi:hypothetical protein